MTRGALAAGLALRLAAVAAHAQPAARLHRIAIPPSVRLRANHVIE